MSMIENYVIFHWKDQNGQEAQSFLVTQDQGPGGETAYLPLAASAQACTAAALIAVQFVTTTRIVATPADGPYKTVWDRGVLFGNIPATGRQQRQALVGPQAAIFVPGTKNIDLSNPQVAAFQAQVIALLGDSSGNPCGPFKYGKRQSAAGS